MRYPEVRRLDPDMLALARQIWETRQAEVVQNPPCKQLPLWPSRCSKIKCYDTVAGRMGGYTG